VESLTQTPTSPLLWYEAYLFLGNFLQQMKNEAGCLSSSGFSSLTQHVNAKSDSFLDIVVLEQMFERWLE
jgi:hypothetical protein